MKDLKDILNESKVDWKNVHDAILTTIRKYKFKPGMSKDVVDYCDKIIEALEKIQH